MGVEVVIEYHVDKTKVSPRRTFGRVFDSHNGFGVPLRQMRAGDIFAQSHTVTDGCRETV